MSDDLKNSTETYHRKNDIRAQKNKLDQRIDRVYNNGYFYVFLLYFYMTGITFSLFTLLLYGLYKNKFPSCFNVTIRPYDLLNRFYLLVRTNNDIQMQNQPQAQTQAEQAAQKDQPVVKDTNFISDFVMSVFNYLKKKN